MKYIGCIFILFAFLTEPVKSFSDSESFVKTDSLADDSAHFRQAQEFLNDHKDVIKRGILATFDLDLSTEEKYLPLIPKIHEKIESLMDWDQISAQLSFMLIQTFSPDELTQISEFMQTEAGKKFMDFNPILVSYLQEAGLFISLKHQDEIETAILLMLDR